MDWQTQANTVPASIVPEARALAMLGRRAPATGAWREGDPVGDRRFIGIGDLELESGGVLPGVQIAYEQWGALSPARDNAILVLHALTGDSHVVGPAGRRIRARAGGPASSAPGSRSTPTAGSSSRRTCSADARARPAPRRSRPTAPSGARGSRSSRSATRCAHSSPSRGDLGIERFAAVVGGSMGAMHVLEWAIMAPDAVERIAVLAAPAGDHRRPDRAELGADRGDPHRPGVPRRRVLRRARRRGADARPRARPAHGDAQLPHRRRAQPPLRPRMAVRPRSARRRRTVRGRVLPRLPRQQVHAPLRREQLHRAHRGDELPRRRPWPRRLAAALARIEAGASCSASTATATSRSRDSARSPRSCGTACTAPRRSSSPPSTDTTPSSSRTARSERARALLAPEAAVIRPRRLR